LPDFLVDSGWAMFLSNMFINQERYQAVIIQITTLNQTRQRLDV
jgi:hypothetical protein